MGGLNLIQLKNHDIGAHMGVRKFTNTKLLEPNINTVFFRGINATWTENTIRN